MNEFGAFLLVSMTILRSRFVWKLVTRELVERFNNGVCLIDHCGCVRALVLLWSLQDAGKVPLDRTERRNCCS